MGGFFSHPLFIQNDTIAGIIRALQERRQESTLRIVFDVLFVFVVCMQEVLHQPGGYGVGAESYFSEGGEEHYSV